MGKTRTNFIYNALYQIFSIIVPIILAPYLSRRLGVDGTGVYSYTYSIVYYFMLFIMLGVNNYGSRVIAKNRADKKVLSRKFCEIYAVQLFLGIITSAIYILFVVFGAQEYRTLFIIHGFFVLSALLDINWLFYGLEDFNVTVPRSFVVRIINFILILLLVQRAEDLWIYTVIMATTAFVNQLVLWPFLRTRVMLVKPKLKSAFKHTKPLAILFIPVIAVSLYKIMDKVMLGALASVSEVGLYEYAEKINSIPLVVISALGTVMLPKISSIIKDEERVQTYLKKASDFVLFMTVPLFFVFILAAPVVVPLYLGESFSGVSTLAIVLSFSLPFVSLANVVRTQYLIPAEKDRIYVISVIVGAALNLIANLILIPQLGALGACIGTLISEISVMLFQTICVRRKIAFKKIIVNWGKLLCGSIVIFALCYAIGLLDLDKKILMPLQTGLFIMMYIGFRYKYILGLIRKRA